MDSFEWNKVFAALLAGAFVVLGLNFLSEGIFHSSKPAKPGFVIEATEGNSSTAKTDKPVEIPSVSPLLASADLAKGQKVAKKCLACHEFTDGGKNKVGPALYDIVNRKMGSAEGFSYSSAMKAFAGENVWDYDALNKFLLKPKAYLKGTSMGFAGIKKVEDRAALIGYLRSLSTNPAALPEG